MQIHTIQMIYKITDRIVLVRLQQVNIKIPAHIYCFVSVVP